MKTTTNLFINAVATAFSEYTAFGAIDVRFNVPFDVRLDVSLDV